VKAVTLILYLISTLKAFGQDTFPFGQYSLATISLKRDTNVPTYVIDRNGSFNASHLLRGTEKQLVIPGIWIMDGQWSGFSLKTAGLGEAVYEILKTPG
jgi:hypothetical protein